MERGDVIIVLVVTIFIIWFFIDLDRKEEQERLNTRTYLRDNFQKFDVDKNGNLDYNEVGGLVYEYGHPTTFHTERKNVLEYGYWFGKFQLHPVMKDVTVGADYIITPEEVK